MSRRKRWFSRTAGLIQILAMAVAAGVSLWLLFRYAQFGQGPVRETGRLTDKVLDVFGQSGQGPVRETGTGSANERETETETELPEPSRMPEEPLPATVRVRILGDDFVGEYHDQIALTSEKPFVILSADAEKTSDRPNCSREECRVQAGGSWQISMDEMEEGQAFCARQEEDAALTVTSLTRADGHPQYAGELFLYRDAQGIVLVNEVPLEQYLYGVVSSEMPSDYPLEAQKAQAVCARTYACSCIRNAENGALPADLDDSVSYQVYNNYQATEYSRKAVDETRGEVLPLAEIQYYSTSCQSEQRADLDSDAAFRDFLLQEPDPDAEYGSAWLRWETEISAAQILNALAEQSGWHADLLDGISVTKRNGNGQVLELSLYCQGECRTVCGEYAVRQVLSPGQQPVTLMDGRESAGMQLLPSAFFWLEPETGQDPDGGEASAADTDMREAVTDVQERESVPETAQTDGQEAVPQTVGTEMDDAPPIVAVRIHGGGYGHGIGMSQCGAAGLAEKGWNYRKILNYYYGCETSGPADGSVIPDAAGESGL